MAGRYLATVAQPSSSFSWRYASCRLARSSETVPCRMSVLAARQGAIARHGESRSDAIRLKASRAARVEEAVRNASAGQFT